MESPHKAIRSRLLAKAGLSEPPQAKHDFKKLELTEWSPEFERLMRNRLLMGALRYGVLEEKRKRTKPWDLMGAVEKKIALYHETGNTEYLVDIANYCLLEFVCGKRPDKHFTALDNHHDHCQLKKP
jgi:hypothetical protein